jgi:RimJ/RimL family protein N-acetyltransferase
MERMGAHMGNDAFTLRRATHGDIPFIMATERLPGNETLVGRWEDAKHREAMADGRHVYFVACTGQVPVGFAILRDWDVPERVTQIRRVAVATPGQGIGRRMVGAVLDTLFTETAAHRVYLGLFVGNDRAQRAYAAAGLVAEGVARGNAFLNGEPRDQVIMAILRPEWAARRAHGRMTGKSSA